MRFAAVVTVIAAVCAAPVVSAAQGPRMAEADFLRAVECAAYDSLAQFSADSPNAALHRTLLNAEAREQDEAAAQEARRIARRVAGAGARARDAEDVAALRAARASACGITQTAAAPVTGAG